MYQLTSGNETVDKMHTVNLTGNVIPHIWYKKIVRENGKPNHLAISLLADIVYWYRPVEIRDEATGNIIGLQKRFKSDMLQKTYDQYADFYGESDRSVRAALKHLEDMGLIRREFRTITLSNEMKVPNVMFIALNAERLIEITHPREEVKPEISVQKTDMSDQNSTDVLQNNVTPPEGTEGGVKEADATFGHNVQKSGKTDGRTSWYETLETAKNKAFIGGGTKECTGYDKTMQGVLQNNVTPPTKECNIPPQNFVTRVTPEGHTYTENTTESTSQITPENNKSNPINQSPEDIVNGLVFSDGRNDGSDWVFDLLYTPEELRRHILENTEYSWHMVHEIGSKRDSYKVLVELVCDIVCGRRKGDISVGGAMMPVNVVKDRLWSLNAFHIGYVRSCLEKLDNRNGIKNIRNYMLTCLYNAPVTYDQYFEQMVHHDRSAAAENTDKEDGRKTFGQIGQKLNRNEEIT